jgi:hypothetical protein
MEQVGFVEFKQGNSAALYLDKRFNEQRTGIHIFMYPYLVVHLKIWDYGPQEGKILSIASSHEEDNYWNIPNTTNKLMHHYSQ